VGPGVVALFLGQLHYLAQALALVVIAFLAIWFVARPILSARPSPDKNEQTLLATEAAPASLEGSGNESRKALPLGAPAHGAASAGQLIAAQPDGDATPHGRAVMALTEAVDHHPEAALRTLRHWLKDGAQEEAAT
jgi:flagellar biosynthesis/type III secretory pathway M-ring protein FliF/YscJ